MKIYLKWLTVLGYFFLAGGCTHVSNKPELKTVPSVDINKYLGVWYEIATMPAWFQKNLVGVSATYSLRPDGKIKVYNQGRMKTLSGKVKDIVGKAWIADGKDASKLKVSFFLWFAGDYWIIELDNDYQYAVVGDPARRYLWILSREKTMSDQLYDDLMERIKGHGYDVSRIRKSIQ